MSADPPMSRYLAALFAEARPATLVEVRWRAGDGMRQRFVPAADLGGVAREIAGLAAIYDVYVGVLPRWRSGGRRADVVGDGRTVWVDLDRPDALRVLEAVKPVPVLVVASGGAGHAHAYWGLRRAVPPRVIERANARLAFALGGDLRAWDAARILRPPGTVNRKNGTAVELLHDAASTASLGELVGGLSDPPGWRLPTARRQGSAEGVLAVAPAVYVERLTGQRVGRSRKVRCPLHDLSVGEATADGVSPACSVDDASSKDRRASSDPLLLVPPPVYFERLTGLRVGRSGKLHCLFHDDRSPSLHVYREPERGWFCFGCLRGGSVYDLAALLFRRGTRGRDFIELRRELERRLSPPTR